MRRAWVAAAVLSLVAHAGLLHALAARRPAAGAERRRVELELADVRRPAPPPPAPPAAAPPAPPRRALPARAVARAPAPRRAAPPPAAPAAPAPPKVGVDRAQTTPGGSMAVATGVTRDGVMGTGAGDRPAPPAPPPAPPAPRPGVWRGAARVVPIYSVTRMPRPRRPVEPRIPEAFRQASREALVVVEVELDASGRVRAARVLRRAGFGLDEAAVEAALRTEFEPALVGSEPVAVRYQIPFRFRVRG